MSNYQEAYKKEMTGTLISFTNSLGDLKEDAINALRDELFERKEFDAVLLIESFIANNFGGVSL